MTEDTELEGFKSTRYFSRAWALLTKDRGWIKPVLLMTVALLVPIVGLLGVAGYVAEWARLTAWNVNSAPKQRGVRVGACIASGWRVFVVALAWAVCMAIVGAIAAAIPLFGGLAAFAWWLFSFFLAVVIVVAALRATIYQKIRAGLRVKTIWQMASHDATGLLRVMGIWILGMLIIWAICAVVLTVSLTSVLPQLFSLVMYIDQYEALLSPNMQFMFAMQMLASIAAALGPALLVILLVCGFVGVILSMLVFTAVGLWMRQFDVASWGREEDPVPGLDGEKNAPAASDPVMPGVPGEAAATATSSVESEPVAPEKSEAAAAPESADEPESATPAPAPVSATPAPAPEPGPEPEVEVVEVETVAAAPEVVEAEATPEEPAAEEPAPEPEAAVEEPAAEEPTPEPESTPSPEAPAPAVEPQTPDQPAPKKPEE